MSQFALHRGMGTANERRAAGWLAAKLRGMGYEAAEEPFRTTRDNLYLIPAQIFACAAAAACIALFTHAAWLALIVDGYGVAVLLAEASGYGVDFTAMPRFRSQNILTGPVREAARTVYVTAHYDTQRGSFLFHPKFVDRLPVFFRCCYAAVALCVVAVVSGYLLWPSLALCSCALAVFLAAEISGRYTPGANDNGSGVALALWLASAYAERRAEFPADCDLRFLFTGSEEAGERGMKAFLKSHRAELDRRRARFVNLDNLGTGALTYLSGEGMLIYRRAGPALLAIARSMRAPRVSEQANLLLPTDALPAAALGFEAISFLGKDHAGRLGHYHRSTDTFDNVDTEFLRFQQEFFVEYLKRAMAEGA
jgi:hypothetical protein